MDLSMSNITATLAQLLEVRVLAVCRLRSADGAAELVDALVAGGVSIVEFTFDNPQAVPALEAARDALPADGALGGGTVTTVDQVRQIADLGGRFVVAPGFDPEIVTAALERDLLPLPGVFTPTELSAAVRAGAPAVKVFPAVGGGPAYVKALGAPFAGVPLIPTGGVTPDNAADYLRAGAAAVGMGGALAKPGDPAAVTAAATQVVANIAAVD